MPFERSGPVRGLLDREVVVLDELSFEEVCRSHRARVRGLCRKLLRSELDAEDAVQETLLRAYKAWPQFRTGDDPWPWLATIAANLCRDAGRRDTRAAAFAASLDADEQYSPDCYDEAARNARRALVQEALASLPRSVGRPLYLRDIEGWSVPDIARLRGRSVASVRTSLTRSRKVLATRIEALARAKHQWPLPASAPVLARVRSRLTRVRAAADGSSASALVQLDAVMSTLTAIRLTGAVQVATAVIAIAALTAATGDARSATASTSVADSPTMFHAASEVDNAPTKESASGAAAGPDQTTPRPATAAVTVGGARVNEAGVTETPAAEATPPEAPIAEGGTSVFVGPTRIDCSSDQRPKGAWESFCEALAQAPLPPLGPDADED